MGFMDSVFGGGSGYESSRSFVDPKQQPFLDFTRNLGRSLVGQYGAGAGQFSQQAGAGLFGQGLGLLGSLSSNPFLTALQGQAGGNPGLVNAQIGQLQADLGRSFRQEVLPGIGRDAVGIGAFGGSRQGVAEGIAAQGFADAFSRGVTDIQSADALRAQQAAISGGGLLAQGALGGIAGLGSLFDVGLGQFTGGFAPLSIYSQILGAPTVLSEGQSKSSNSNGIMSAFAPIPL